MNDAFITWANSDHAFVTNKRYIQIASTSDRPSIIVFNTDDDKEEWHKGVSALTQNCWVTTIIHRGITIVLKQLHVDGGVMYVAEYIAKDHNITYSHPEYNEIMHFVKLNIELILD